MPDTNPAGTGRADSAREQFQKSAPRRVRLGKVDTPAQRAVAARRIAHAVAAGRLSARAAEVMLRAVRMVGRQQQVADEAARVAGKVDAKHTKPLVNLTLLQPPRP